MPISRPEKFTVKTDGLAQSRICFPTENEPIFPGLKPESVAQFTRILTKTNSQYAIQKTGVNSGSGHPHQRAPAAIPCLRSPDPLQKSKERSHSHPAAAKPEARRRSQKYTTKAILQCSRQGGRRTQLRKSIAPAVQSNSTGQPYSSAHAGRGC